MCFSSLVLSQWPKIFKGVRKAFKIPSLLSAHAWIYVYKICLDNLREFVLTHVVLAPGARGMGGPSSGPWRHFRGIRKFVPNRANDIRFYSKSVSGDTPVQCFVYFFIPLSSKTPSFESFFGRLPARNALKTRCFN